jgi:histidine kinase
MNKARQLIYESDESLIYIDESASQERRLLKVLRSSAPDLDQILRFNNEYEFTKNLQIEGVRKALERKKDESQYALVLEYVDGCTLEEAFIGKKHSLEKILEVFIHITEALGKLHEKGIIHKDINARNILWNACTKHPVIIDFGISNRIDLVFNNLGNPDKIKGTLTHMSPEQTGRVNRKIDSRSDLYSLGITLFQLLAGKLPYASADSMELVHFHIAKSVPLLHRENPAIPEIVSRIVAKLMAKNAEDRYQTAFGLKYDLEKCLAQLQKWNKINDFALGEKDYSRKFQIPQKLYGRYEEVKTLLKAFDRVTKGSTELLLVAGYSYLYSHWIKYNLYFVLYCSSI